MPKLKGHKGSRKRMKLTGSGKLRRTQSGKSHLAAGMSSKRTRNLRGTTVFETPESKKYMKFFERL